MLKTILSLPDLFFLFLHFRAKCSHGCFYQRLKIFRVHREGLRDTDKMFRCALSSQFKTIGYSDRMNALIDQTFGLLHESTSQNYDSRGSVTDLVVLRLGELDHELGDFVIDVHVLEDCGAIIGDGHIAVRADHQLIQTFWPQRCLERICHAPSCKNVWLQTKNDKSFEVCCSKNDLELIVIIHHIFISIDVNFWSMYF